jgi:hypothetical protein
MWEFLWAAFSEVQTVAYLLVNGYRLDKPSDYLILSTFGLTFAGMMYTRWLSGKLASASKAGHQAGTNETVKAMVEAMKPSESGSGLSIFWIIVILIVIVAGLGYLLQG